jgi:hypothetical protein
MLFRYLYSNVLILSGLIRYMLQTIVRCQLCHSLSANALEYTTKRTSGSIGNGMDSGECDDGFVSVATGPVRVDLAGGWSDTAPMSYEYPGAVRATHPQSQSSSTPSAECHTHCPPIHVLILTSCFFM